MLRSTRRGQKFGVVPVTTGPKKRRGKEERTSERKGGPDRLKNLVADNSAGEHKEKGKGGIGLSPVSPVS